MKKNYFMILCLLVGGLLFAQDVDLHKEIDRSILQNAFSEQTDKSFTQDDLSNWRIDGEASSLNKSLWHYYVIQTHNGVDVENAITNFTVTNGQEARFNNSSFIVDLKSKVNGSSPSISPMNAVQNAASHLKLEISEPLQQLESLKNGQKIVFNKAGISQEDIKVSLIYYPTNDTREEFKLAWDVSMFMLDGSHWWNVKIDAATGTYLGNFDFTISCTFENKDHLNHNHGAKSSFKTKANKKLIDVCVEQEALEDAALATLKSYRVLRYDIESPNHGPFTLEVNPEDITASPLGWHSSGTTPDFYQETQGNNVRAIDDSSNPGNNGPETVESSGDVYDYAYGGPFVAAGTYIDAAVTNLFYMCNAVHDIYYLYGFDEASRNFQNNNFGNGGSGNDAIRADAQDRSGTNNANFSTPADGGDGVMQMFLWDIAPVSNLLTINDTALAGDYVALDNGFDPGNVAVTTPITANLVLAEDGVANASIYDACENLTNGAAVNGNIAVVLRGDCNFTDKVINAQNRNAAAVLVVNNVAGDISMGGGDAAVSIPAYSINQAEGDAIVAALLGGATISATFNAPPSGFQNIDGDFDNGVIAHEYGHGIHIRLSGGTSVNCSTGYTEGLSEGWGDYIGKILQLSNVDNGIFLSGTGTFVVGQPITGDGIRPAPYSGDIANNPMTHQSLVDDPTNATFTVPHGVGSVFAGILWDMTWDMIAVHGFESNLYNVSSTAGNVKTLKILVEALKNIGCFAGFNDTRDEIIQADQDLFGGENFCVIWSAFARRGYGFSSTQGSTNSTSDGDVEFDLPAGCSPDYLLTIGGPTDSCEGTSLEFNMVFNAQNGWNTNIGFAVSGLPAGATATFSPTTISDTGLLTLTIDNLPAGAQSITVTPNGDASKDLVLPINVQESNADLTDGETEYQVDGAGFTSFSDTATINVSDGSNLDLQLPDTAFVGTLLWTAPNGTTYTTNTVSFAGVTAGDTAVEGNWTVVPTFTLDCPGSLGSQTINFTVTVASTICFVPRVYLQGPLGTGTSMSDGLRAGGLIPTTSPYADAVIAPASVFTVTGNDAIVDWVWLEVREVGNNTNILASTSALVQRDGDIVNYVDGTGTIKLGLASGNYLLSVNHRNHLGVMSGTLALDASCKVIDFTDGSLTTFGSNAQSLDMGSGLYSLWRGDATEDGQITFVGATIDVDLIKDLILNDAGNIFNAISYTVSDVYSMNDINMDGDVKFIGADLDPDLIKDAILAHPANIFDAITFTITEQLP